MKEKQMSFSELLEVGKKATEKKEEVLLRVKSFFDGELKPFGILSIIDVYENKENGEKIIETESVEKMSFNGESIGSPFTFSSKPSRLPLRLNLESYRFYPMSK